MGSLLIFFYGINERLRIFQWYVGQNTMTQIHHIFIFSKLTYHLMDHIPDLIWWRQ